MDKNVVKSKTNILFKNTQETKSSIKMVENSQLEFFIL